MTILLHEATRGNPGRIDVRPHGDKPQPVAPTLDDIRGDPRYSDRAKRLAEYLDGRCKADGKWAAWPKVSTIASHLGWDGTDHGGRKRVERGFRELIEAGLLGRMRLGELVEWFDSQGQARGLAWPRELPRNLRRTAVICVLGWRIPGPCPGLPILPACDTSVPSSPTRAPFEGDKGVASFGTRVSHPGGTLVSHPSYMNVRTSNDQMETTDPRTHAREPDGETVGSSSSRSRESGGSQEGTAPTVEADPATPAPDLRLLAGTQPLAPTAPGSPRADSLASTLDRVMDKAKVHQTAAVAPAPGPVLEPAPIFGARVEPPSDDQVDDRGEPDDDQAEGPRAEPDAVADGPARAALIARVEEIAPGPENREVRRAIYDSIPSLLKTAKLAGSSSPFDHVRMALEKAAGNRKRRDSIESLARGILKNWATEGLPAINAPVPPGQPKARPDLAAEAEARAERERVKEDAEAKQRAEAEALKARWEALPGPAREAIEARVLADNPGLGRWRNMLLPLCLAAMVKGLEGQSSAPSASKPLAPILAAVVETAPESPIPSQPSAVGSAEPSEVVPARLVDRLSARTQAGPAETPETVKARLLAQLQSRPPTPPAESPKAEASEANRVDPPPAAAAAAVPPAELRELTEGQRAFLAGLATDQRSRFDAWPEARQARTLAVFANGLDRTLLNETLRALASPGGAP